MLKRNRTQRGVAAVEFAFVAMFTVTMLIGAMIIGTELIRMIQAVQFTRDIGHMWARGTDFTDKDDSVNKPNQNLAVKLGQGLNFQLGGGDGVAILSAIEYLSNTECPTGCANNGKWVLTQRWNFGNTALPKSRYLPNPPASELDDQGNVKFNTSANKYYYLTDPSLALQNFNVLPLPMGSNGQPTNVGFNSGTTVYLIETYFQTTPVAGFYDYPYLNTVAVF